MNSALMFSRATDEWETPQDTFDALHAEFNFTFDAAASDDNHKLPDYHDKQQNSLTSSWELNRAVWLNPPYSKCREFIAKAAEEARKGCTVVCLVPSRTDTRWWAESVLPFASEIRFVKGRLKFGGSSNGAPFPSAIVVFRPPFDGSQLIVSSFSRSKDGRWSLTPSRTGNR